MDASVQPDPTVGRPKGSFYGLRFLNATYQYVGNGRRTPSRANVSYIKEQQKSGGEPSRPTGSLSPVKAMMFSFSAVDVQLSYQRTWVRSRQ